MMEVSATGEITILAQLYQVKGCAPSTCPQPAFGRQTVTLIVQLSSSIGQKSGLCCLLCLTLIYGIGYTFHYGSEPTSTDADPTHNIAYCNRRAFRSLGPTTHTVSGGGFGSSLGVCSQHITNIDHRSQSEGRPKQTNYSRFAFFIHISSITAFALKAKRPHQPFTGISNLATYRDIKNDYETLPEPLIEALAEDDWLEFASEEDLSLSFHRNLEERTRGLVHCAIGSLNASADVAEGDCNSENSVEVERYWRDQIQRDSEAIKKAILAISECWVGLQAHELRDELLLKLHQSTNHAVDCVQKAFELSRIENGVFEDKVIPNNEEAFNKKEERLDNDEEGEKANAARQRYQKYRKKLLSCRVEKLWVHLTISRDQTAGSDFRKEQLLALSSHPIVKVPIATKGQDVVGPLREVQAGGSHSPFQTFDILVGERSSTSGFKTQNLHTLHLSGTSLKDQVSEMVPSTVDLGTPLIVASEAQESLNASSNTALQSSIDESMLDDVDALRDRVRRLEEELGSSQRSTGRKATWQILYFLKDPGGLEWTTYLDEPTWYMNQSGEAALRASSLIHNVEAYLNNKVDTAFVISRYYDSSKNGREVENASREGNALPKPEPSRETIRLWSQSMTTAFKEFIKKQSDFQEKIGKFDDRQPIDAPYLFWYHYRSLAVLDELTPQNFNMMELLTSWIEDHYGDLYTSAEEQRARNVVTPETVQFLIHPGEVVVWKEKKDLMAAVAESWPSSETAPHLTIDIEHPRWSHHHSTNDDTPSWTWSLDSREMRYDGSFYYEKKRTETTVKAKSFRSEVPISQLTVYPLKYASDEWKVELEKRGKMFWSCRKKKLVSYDDSRGFYGSSERFIVDFLTYEELHSDTANFEYLYPMIDDPDCDRMDIEMMESDEPPPAPDIYIFPNTIVAYNLGSKKWIDLEVDKIREVSWNKDSFDHLVVDHDTKELVHALVTNQIALERGTDIIDRKGNGLIILLHGGPGTGKTFTAESVAEIAEKPLYRVTCGDIGTKPEAVEKYLESVLYLGKRWGCVVLLDEAEVFLEQRRLTDLERNALVSVFLRVLEYYEGILILTSNRVGTFDEAFKSRIQLSLHYENLTKGQRRLIWRNFLNRLKSLDKAIVKEPSTDPLITNDSIGIDFDSIECFLDDLAKHEMNGRQIRNAITTARQLAQFKNEKMRIHHLNHVIKVSAKFDSYLKKLQEGLSDDDAARGYGLR